MRSSATDANLFHLIFLRFLPFQELIPDSWLICETCSYPFPTVNSLKNHKSRVHQIEGDTKDKDVQCQFCDRILHFEWSYHNHANAQHSGEISSIWCKCLHCKMYYPNEDILEEHIAVSHTGKVDCSFCSKILETGDKFFAHVWRDHEQLIRGE